MTESLALARLTRDECAVVASRAVLVVPLGATEQHGPHLPASTDTVLVTAIAQAAAARVSAAPVVVTSPTLHLGCSDHHLPFGATISLANSTLVAIIGDVCRSAVASGFRALVIVNGHGGNAGAARCAIDAVSSSLQATVACCAYWECVGPDALPQIAGRVPGHAGAFETSLMLVVAPELVDVDAMRASPLPTPARIPGAHVPTPPRIWREIDGFTDDPTSASREFGRAALDVLAAGVAGCIDDVWRLHAALN